MVGGRSARGEVAEEVVAPRAAGDRAEGPARCCGCGYGVAVTGPLPSCPMCGGTSWRPDAARAFPRTLLLDRDTRLP